MFIQKDLTKIKSSLSDNVGHKVRLTAKKGRKQTVTREGVIESTYPSIFIIKLNTPNDSGSSERRVSYSYTDVLTRTVELIICDPDDTEKDA
ncbi:Veg family protein [Ructibacterium gallinarum]|uniref:Veg family protein n=1 Tax=Ructibacterium gallinarum TaxID=2779355 RepID=A0A9D5M0L7_9FIRM|nr:Veg family protein [Ructibacterium gallinarum]MBE5039951.1 Veg family protein [Ructibacterium gallinarum]